MRPEDLFAAIGGVESSRLERSELTATQSSRKMEETNVKHMNTKRLIRNLFIAAAIIAILSVTAYAAVNARIRLETRRIPNDQATTEELTENYDVEIDFRRTTNEYLELDSVYPQTIPEGLSICFVSDKALGVLHVVYENPSGEEALRFIAQLGSDGGQLELVNVISEEAVTVQGCPGTLYRQSGGHQTLIWQNEEQGIGYTLLAELPNLDVDLLAIAESVGPGEPLTPTLAAGYGTALTELGDYRITALPDGFRETDFMASPLENGGGWYAYVRRWYGDKITTDNTIYFEYEHFRLESDEQTSHYVEPVENTPETVLALYGGGDSVTIQGMPGAVSDGCVIWVDWEAQTAFRIYAANRTQQELLSIAESVQRVN